MCHYKEVPHSGVCGGERNLRSLLEISVQLVLYHFPIGNVQLNFLLVSRRGISVSGIHLEKPSAEALFTGAGRDFTGAELGKVAAGCHTEVLPRTRFLPLPPSNWA